VAAREEAMSYQFLLVLALATEPPSSPQPATAARSAPDSQWDRLAEARDLLDRRASPEAMKILEVLLPAAEARKDEALVAETLHETARAHYFAGDYGTAVSIWERALTMSRTQANRPLQAQILRAKGKLHEVTGAYAQSIRCSEEAVAIFQEVGDRQGAARAWIGIGAARDMMGEHRRALEAYEEARPALEETEDRWLYLLLNEVAITYKNLGRYEDALRSHARSLEWQRKTGNKHGEAVSLVNTGNTYALLGQYERAIEHYQAGLTLSRQMNERRGEAILLGNLADAWNRLDEPGRALGYARQQLQIAQEVGLRHFEASALHTAAASEVALGDLEKGRKDYQQALELYQQIGARGAEQDTRLAMADLDLREGRPAEARLLAEQALALGPPGGSPESDWQAHFTLARVARSAKRPDEAARHLRAGIEVIDSLRGRVLTDTGKIGYLEARLQVFYELVDLLLERGYAAQALEAAEAARGRAFSDLLAARQVALRPGEAAALTAIRDGEARLRAQERARPADEAVVAELARTQGATEAELSGQLRTLHDEQPELASLVAVEPLTRSEITETAKRLDATVLEYLVTDKRLFVWVVRPTGEIASATVDIGRDALREKLRSLHAKLGGLDLEGLRDSGAVRRGLADLYKVALAPVARHLPSDPRGLVYVIPHDSLFLLPFAALLDERGRYLVETHTLASAPSLGVLRYTAEKKRRAISPAAPRLLALADARPPRGSGLSPLPGAREEVRRVGRGIPAGRRTILAGEAATEASVKGLGPRQTILHFAVHGLIDDSRPLESALALTESDGEDGWLRVREAFGLDLRADLVVLSGCSTGLGKVSGDGILGLSRALLYAGTPSVVVSLWDVSDLATLHLMDGFYNGLRLGRSKAHALRAAQLRTLRVYPHPALWSAFLLVGEAR
jgi:CHAT domain-containing protein